MGKRLLGSFPQLADLRVHFLSLNLELDVAQQLVGARILLIDLEHLHQAVLRLVQVGALHQQRHLFHVAFDQFLLEVTLHLPQIKRQLVRRLVALVSILGQCPQHNRFQLRRKHRQKILERRRWLARDLQQRRGRAFPFKGQMARHHLVKHNPRRKQIRPPIHRLPVHLLGRHVIQRPNNLRRALGDVLISHLGDSEIEDLDAAILAQHDVRRFDIPMHYIAVVCVAQPFTHLDDDVGLVQQAQRPARRQHRIQVLALQILHYQIRIPVEVSQVVNRHDVRVNQAGQRLCLDEEPLQLCRIFREPAGDHLDGDWPVQVGIVGLVHHSHATAPDDLDNVILPDFCGHV